MNNPPPSEEYPVADEAVETEFKRLMRAQPNDLYPEKSRELITKIRAQARDLALNRGLLLEEAQRRKIEVSDREIEHITTEIIKQFGDKESFERHLLNINSSLDKTTRAIRSARLIEILTGQIVATVVQPTDKEVSAYLKEYVPVEHIGTQNPELLRQIKEKTRALLHRLRQNRILNEFIGELRKRKGITRQDRQ